MTTIRNLEDLRQYREQIMAFARQHRVKRILVFGSLVRGEMRMDSDIDLLVDFEADYKLRDHIRLCQGLRQMLGRRVEVVDRYSLRQELSAAILEEARNL